MNEVINELPAHTSFPILDIAIVIAIAGLLGLGLMRLKQPPLVGFILAGLALGPTGLSVIENSDNVTVLAELGVLVLLFFIGMEISLKAFVLSIRQALIVAGGQICIALLVAGLIGALIGASMAESIVLGFIIAISSTVVAMKMLDDMNVLRGDIGRITIGVLIAQDLAVVPMLILVTSMGGDNLNVAALILKMAIAVGALALLMWWLTKYGKIKIPHIESIENNVEMLTLGALAFCFSAAAISGLAGLSPVYGAFVAGILVGNSTLRSKIIPVIEPIQSILLVVFFLSIGLLIDLTYIINNLKLVILASLFIIILKSLLNIVLLRATGADRQTALVAGFSMAQIGEFSFVLAAAGFTSGLLSPDIYRLAISVTAISLLTSPIWSNAMHRIDNAMAAGLKTYNQALKSAYAAEIHEMEKGRIAMGKVTFGLHLRYRALRLAIYHRRHLKKNTKEDYK